tara:strand:- start:658 stop:855 length:198 start_codon:yes stop_codon:yes gene_type:complete
MAFTTERELYEHYSDDTITHNNINDLINDWINELQLQDLNNNLFTEETLKEFLKTSYSNVTDWSF